ncbi:hypothetical protein DL98DRAFT_48725 [Cadophora sp. DSE1049]|nr:hypothetical protein DL98DRAFT_48725 [Cadophora sp. DSE1049]
MCQGPRYEWNFLRPCTASVQSNQGLLFSSIKSTTPRYPIALNFKRTPTSDVNKELWLSISVSSDSFHQIQCRPNSRTCYVALKFIHLPIGLGFSSLSCLGKFFDSQSTATMMAVASNNPTFATTLIQRSNILLPQVGKSSSVGCECLSSDRPMRWRLGWVSGAGWGAVELCCGVGVCVCIRSINVTFSV